MNVTFPLRVALYVLNNVRVVIKRACFLYSIGDDRKISNDNNSQLFPIDILH